MVLHGAAKRESAARILAASGFDPGWPATFIHGCPGPRLLLDRAAASGVVARLAPAPRCPAVKRRLTRRSSLYGMSALAAPPHRLLVVALAVTLSVIAGWPARTVAQEADLTATLQLPQGEIDFPVEPGTLHFFDEEGAPFAVQVIDGCAVNDHWWLLGVGLGSAAVPLTIFDERSGMSSRTVLPAFRPGEPIGAVFEPEALAICRAGATGGLPQVGGTRRVQRGEPGVPGRGLQPRAALRRRGRRLPIVHPWRRDRPGHQRRAHRRHR